MINRTLARLTALVLLAVALAGRAAAQDPKDGFQVGDRILLRVEADSQLSDTFTVAPGPTLLLPVIGQVPLAGVRRAEVEPYLARWIGRFLREPVVHARALVRLSVLGEVARPGFYAVPADAVLTDAMMAAGGPTREAKFTALRVERDGAQIWSGTALQRAIAQGLTLEQMGLHGGDRVIVPRQRSGAATLQVLGVLVTLPAAIYGITRIF